MYLFHLRPWPRMGPRRCQEQELKTKGSVFAATMEGDFLPLQLIYQGKTTICLPSTKFPSNWHITFTPTHWANKITTLAYIDQIILPYIKRKRRECGLPNEQRALCIFDNFKAQLTYDVLRCWKTTMLMLSMPQPIALTVYNR